MRRLCTGRGWRAERRRTLGNGAEQGPLYCRTCEPTTRLGCLFEIVETLVLTLIIFFVIQNFVAQPYKVQQHSMERTLEPEQYVLVDKLTPRFDTYKRGDIVVFHPPPDWARRTTPFIKRVIGRPGDIVEIRDDGLVYINDRRSTSHTCTRRAGRSVAADDDPARAGTLDDPGAASSS